MSDSKKNAQSFQSDAETGFARSPLCGNWRAWGARGVVSAGTLRAALCAALIATCPEASARSPQPRVESGTVETIGQDSRTRRDQRCCGTIGTIDQNARMLRIQREGEAVPLTLVWNSQTRFIEGTRSVTAAEVTKGTAVTVSYHTPFFGKTLRYEDCDRARCREFQAALTASLLP